MANEKYPVTAAVRVLRAAAVAYRPCLYDYVDKGGTAESSRQLGVDEHAVIKTLVMQDERAEPMLVLMHGDCEVSTKTLARLLGVKSITPCTPEVANRHSGYLVGGTSPFGIRRAMPVLMQQSILALPQVYINGGKRGFLLALAPADVQKVLKPQLVDVANRHPD